MKSHRLSRALRILAMVVIGAAVFGYLVMSLWNWLMPAIFGLRTLNFGQALGLLLLSKLLFGGIHRHGGGHGWKRGLGERWARMTPDEKERFRAGMRGRRGFGCGPAERETVSEQAAV